VRGLLEPRRVWGQPGQHSEILLSYLFLGGVTLGFELRTLHLPYHLGNIPSRCHSLKKVF
jgi:hypothetical protein